MWGKEKERKDEISVWIIGDVNETFCKGITDLPNTQTHKEKKIGVQVLTMAWTYNMIMGMSFSLMSLFSPWQCASDNTNNAFIDALWLLHEINHENAVFVNYDVLLL